MSGQRSGRTLKMAATSRCSSVPTRTWRITQGAIDFYRAQGYRVARTVQTQDDTGLFFYASQRSNRHVAFWMGHRNASGTLGCLN
jgi:hypothetical protein